MEDGARVKAFVVTLADARDTFLEVADALAGKGANVTALSLLPGDPPRLGFTVDLEDAARLALHQTPVDAEEYEVIELSLANTPGSLALAAHALSDAGVPIRMLLTMRASLGRATDLIAVDDAEAARLVVRGLSEDVLLD
jgi:hypothetical protein